MTARNLIAAAGAFIGTKKPVVTVYKISRANSSVPTEWRLIGRSHAMTAAALRECLKASEEDRPPSAVADFETFSGNWPRMLTEIQMSDRAVKALPFVLATLRENGEVELFATRISPRGFTAAEVERVLPKLPQEDSALIAEVENLVARLDAEPDRASIE